MAKAQPNKDSKKFSEEELKGLVELSDEELKGISGGGSARMFFKAEPRVNK
ncbi:hypothetical protein [Synechococcus sp. UW179A]|uniref:hypothetical protein n=1 Tax=Synechococcus sp. UW179A TaxID=2575510 RepID=UPI00148346BC|nr:hypothetical protein [Synechococcus sp. UW179A]